MAATIKQQFSNSIGKLKPLKDYIIELYKVGGIPLVLIALGAAIILFKDFEQTYRLVISCFLIGTGVFTWLTSIYIAIYRWKVEIELTSKQNALALEAICNIAVKENSDVAETKTNALIKALQKMGLQWTKKQNDEK